MRRLPQNLSILAVSVLTMSSLAVAPVFAEHGSNSKETEIETHNNVSGTQVNNESGKLRAEAAKLLATQRQDKKVQKPAADRQKACSARQAEITTREQNYARNAQKHLDTFSSIYARVLQFQTDKQLTSADLPTLKTTADAKKAAAATAVTALSSTDLKIDCTAADPAATVATLKTAVSNARTALQDYRTAVKDFTVALSKALGNSANSTGSTSADTTTTPSSTGGAQ